MACLDYLVCQFSLVAPIMIYAAIMMALDKSQNAVVAKLIQGFILILLFAIVQVILSEKLMVLILVIN